MFGGRANVRSRLPPAAERSGVGARDVTAVAEPGITNRGCVIELFDRLTVPNFLIG